MIDQSIFTVGGNGPPPARQSVSKTNKFARKSITIEASAENAPLPILYGEVSAPGYISAYGVDGAGNLIVRVIWGAGEVYCIKSVFLNGAALPSTVKYVHYRGTPYQAADGVFMPSIATITGYDEAMTYTRPAGVLGACYSVFFIPAAAITDSPRFQAIIQGSIVYDPREAAGDGDPFHGQVGYDLRFVGANGSTPTTGIDTSDHANTIAWSGGANIQGNKANFTGTGYVTLTETANTKFGTGFWSLEFKYTPATIAAGTDCILQKGTSSSPNLCLRLHRNANDIYISLSGNGTSWNIASSEKVGDNVLAANTEIDIVIEYTSDQYLITVGGSTYTIIRSDRELYDTSTPIYIGGSPTETNMSGTVRAVRLTTGVFRYGGSHDASATPYADSFYLRPGYVYSDTPALCAADIAYNPFYGLGVGTVNGLIAAVEWNEALLGGLPRCRLSLIIDDNQPTTEWLDLLATYAECFWYTEGEGITLIPDRPVGVEHPTGWEMTLDGAAPIDASWTRGTGWTYTAGEFLHSAGAASAVSQTISKAFEAGVVYIIRFRLAAASAGACGLSLDSLPLIDPQSAAGLYTLEYTATGLEAGSLEILCDAAFVGSISEAAIYRKYWLDNAIVKNSLSVSCASEFGTATKMLFSYTVPQSTAADWAQAVYSTALAGVDTGDVRLVETSLRMEGVFRIEEASTKSRTRLAKMQGRSVYAWTSTDRAVALRRGTVTHLVDTSYGIDALVLVEDVQMIEPGRYAVKGSNYDPAHWPSDVELPADVGLIPVGVIAFSSNGLVPSGWTSYNTADGKLILGAGAGVAVNSTGGTATLGPLSFDSGDGGAHETGGADIFYRIAETSGTIRNASPPGSASGVIIDDASVAAPDHHHALSVASFTPDIPKRRKVLIQKTGSAATEMPANTEVFGKEGLVVPNLSRVVAAAGRFLEAYGTNGDAGSLSAQSVPVTISGTDASHTHYDYSMTTTGSLRYNESSTGYPYDDGYAASSHNHGGTAYVGVLHAIRRRRLALYWGAGAYAITQGVIFLWSGSLSALPDEFTLMDGKLGTVDMSNLFVTIANTGENWTDIPGAASHQEILGGKTAASSHNHAGSTTITGLPKVNLLHAENVAHSHGILAIQNWMPPYYALGFIMYNPNPVASWIDVGFLISGGEADGSTTIVDDGPDGLTATISASPEYDSAQTLFALNSILNGAGDRVSYPSFNWGRKFTLEGFFRVGTATDGTMMGNRISGAEDFSIQYNAGVGIEFVLDDAVQHTAADPGTGAWFYVALDYDGARWRFYYGLVSGGVAHLVGTVSDVITAHDTDCFIGNNSVPDSPFLGHYAQVRHTRGAALYKSSAFAIPAAPFATA